jgi:hypothetical protein
LIGVVNVLGMLADAGSPATEEQTRGVWEMWHVWADELPQGEYDAIMARGDQVYRDCQAAERAGDN